MLMEFKLKCKVPSGENIKLKELDNKTYQVLSKYIASNIFDFYEELNDFFKIDKLNLLDKVYSYILAYAYFIKPTIQRQEGFGNVVDYSLFDICDTIESIDLKPDLKYELELKSGGLATCFINIPFAFMECNGDVAFNPLSGIHKITLSNNNSYIINSQKDLEFLELCITPKDYKEINKLILEHFNYNISFIPDSLEIPLLSPLLYKFIAQNLYGANLEYLFSLQYNMLRHLNMSFSDYNALTPADTNIYLNKLLEEKERERKENEEKGAFEN